VLSRNHDGCGKAISITYSECVSVALVIQPSKGFAVFYRHLWPVSLYLIFPLYQTFIYKERWNGQHHDLVSTVYGCVEEINGLEQPYGACE
jgi:hypothetical protein